MSDRAATVYFDTLLEATEALLIVLLRARSADSFFKFSGTSAEKIIRNGLRLEGDFSAVLEEISEKVKVVHIALEGTE